MMTKFFLVILILLQTQPTRISKLVWVAAAVVFVAAISALVYFLSRLKKGEKEMEEDDWRNARHSLFVEPAEPVLSAPIVAVEQPAKVISQDHSDGAAAPANALVSEELPVIEMIEPSQATPPSAQTEVLATPVQEPQPDRLEIDRAAEAEARATQLLGSQTAESPEAMVLGDEVWAELDREEPPPQNAEPLPVTRVEQRAAREKFETPAIRPLAPPKTPFEAPRIDRIIPQSTTPSTTEFSPRPSPLPADQPKSEPRLPERPLTVPAPAPRARAGVLPAGAGRRSAGSVLGLPAESTQGPLILGDPSRPRSEVGIGSLTNYGKETGADRGGRGGMVALALTILVVGGSVLAYFYVPSVHARVDSAVSRLRGDPPVEPPAPPPRAHIIAAASEAVKNLVKARGSVFNISTEPLEDLSLEVSLERGPNAAADARTVPVTPNRLDPQQQGRYEFEYDGSKAKGYPGGYRIIKLMSNGVEVKFKVPGQTRSP